MSEIIKVFDENLLKNDGTVVCCTTEEQANLLLQWAHNQGLKWGSGNSYLENNHWGAYCSEICYCLKKGSYGPRSSFPSNGYSVYNFEKVFKNTKTKRKIKHLNKKLEISKEKEDQKIDFILEKIKENNQLKNSIYLMIKSFEK